MERKYLQLTDVELKIAREGKGQFEGYASTFGGIDAYNDTIVAGAYKSIIDAVKSGSRRMPKMFFNHKQWDVPIGRWIEMEEDEKGLFIKGELTPGHPMADMVKAAMSHGTLDGLSIGYQLSKSDYEYRYDDGMDDAVRVIKNISDLREVSVVTYPADDPARVDLASVKSSLDQIGTIREFEDFLRDAGGFSKSLAAAVAGQAKRIFSQRESGEGEKLILPPSLQLLIAENLKSVQTLKEK